MSRKNPDNLKKGKQSNIIPSLTGIKEEELLHDLLKSPPMPKGQGKEKKESKKKIT